MTLRSIVRGLLIVPFVVSAASAQYSNRIGLASGTKVRVMAPGIFPERTTATVLAAQNDTIVMARSGGAVSFLVPVRDIQKLEISNGRSRFEWAGLGAVAGLLAGGIIGGTIGGRDDPTGLGAASGFFVGAFQGVLGGAIIGGLAAPERWVNYPLPLAH
ncbi:MAG: hypothetical protein ABIZ36_03755 [Gemmatimonadaceae bacterium]